MLCCGGCDGCELCVCMQGGNDVGPSGAASLAEAFKHTPGLQELYFVRIDKKVVCEI